MESGIWNLIEPVRDLRKRTRRTRRVGKYLPGRNGFLALDQCSAFTVIANGFPPRCLVKHPQFRIFVVFDTGNHIHALGPFSTDKSIALLGCRNGPG
jgi:hypothetical protein